MKLEEKTWRSIDRIARAVNSPSTKGRLQRLRDRVENEIQRTAVKVLDRVVGKLAGREVRTIPDGRTRPRKVYRPSTPPRLRVVETPPSGDLVGGRASETVGDRPDPRDDGRCNMDRLVLLIRNGERAFTYWEISKDRARGSLGELRLIDEATGQVLQETRVDPNQGRHYFQLDGRPRKYVAELRVKHGDATRVLSRSRPAQIPEAQTASA